jgi:hypothetical protein
MIEDIAVRDAGRKGLGVFALRQFRKGEFIFRRRHARIVAHTSIPSLSPEDRRHLCELDYSTSAVLLAPGCYLNHSCDPNAMRSGVKVFAWETHPFRRGDHDRLSTKRVRLGSLEVFLRHLVLYRRDDRRLLLALTSDAERIPAVRSRIHPARISAPIG